MEATTHIAPGELVILRHRLYRDLDVTGIVVGLDNIFWLVMWTHPDKHASFSWHLDDSLEVVRDDNVAKINRRRSLA